MTELSLSAINATAPYRLRISELGGFDFDIDAGLTYNTQDDGGQVPRHAR